MKITFYRFYGLNVIELSVFLMQINDTCAEGDGNRDIINKKRLLLYFKSHSNYSKYAVEMFTNIAQVKVQSCGLKTVIIILKNCLLH